MRLLPENLKKLLSLQEPLLIVVVGATAVGKTDWAIALAQELQTEIISADSRQFFKEMTFGTAKPSAEQLALVKHHFINSHSITQTYNAGKYEQEALYCLENIFKNHTVAIAVGGSGLYVQALCEGIDTMPPIPDAVRTQITNLYQTDGLAHLLEILAQKDPIYFEIVDKANPQRVMRALEVCLSTNQPYSAFRKEEPKKRNFHIYKIGLTMDRNKLYQRINQRVDMMIAQGLLQEVESLIPYKDHNALQTVGYKEIFDFLAGEYTWQQTVELIKQHTRNYAKRQQTWFGRDANTFWQEVK